MKIYNEVKKIAGKVAQIKRLSEQLEEKGVSVEGVDWYNARLVCGISERDGYLFEGDTRIAEYADDYYVNQWTGYCEDDYYGYMYFKTNVPGQYVKAYYGC